MRFLRHAATLFAFASLAGTVALAQQLAPSAPVPSTQSGLPVNETPRLWFVELNSPPIADGGSAAAVKNDKAQFRSNANKAGVRFKERFAYDTLFNGLSVAVKPSELAKLARIDGVKGLYPVGTVAMPKPTPISPELASAITMTGADIAQNELGLTGAGVKVAVMDTGIDYNHPDLGGCFGPGCRVATGWDFVGDAYNANDDDPVINPDANPDDCAGHGTHVAGIIGANGVVKGVAPGVTFGAYRVFGCEGSTSDDIMIAAMERALADGMQVLNMSIGSAYEWPNAPTAAAASRLVNKGIVVVASIGNDGATGLYSAAAPGLGTKVIGVASFDNLQVTLPAFTVSPDNAAFGYTAATAAPPPPTSGSFPMARTGTTTSTADGCNPLPAGSLAGKVVLIRRGTCGFYNKAFNAQSAGAAGVVLYNNAAGFVTPTVAGTPSITIPVVMVTNTQGANLNARIAAGPTTLTWTATTATVPNPTGGLISSFSSYGLSPDLDLKPDIGAPGGSIYSTFPLELGGYASLSGTSMSSPHVAGGVALLLQAKPNTNRQNVRGILQNSAVPHNWSGNPGLGLLDFVHRQGAGMMQIDKAILATTTVVPAKLALGESEAGGSTRTITVSNTGSSAVTYDLSSVNAISSGPNTFSVGAFLGTATVAFSAPSVTVPAGGSATFSATITPPGTPALGQYGGYIVLTPQDDGDVYRVPFAGFIGDYQAKQVLVPTANGFPWLAKLTGDTLSKVTTGATFTMTGDDIAYFPVHLDHQSRKMQMEIVDADSGRNWHNVFVFEYLPRNASATGFFTLAFDGVTAVGNRAFLVPNGRYVAKLSVLKALGDESNPAHWETWTSPVITIARP
jgi:subtilisin family serine protease